MGENVVLVYLVVCFFVFLAGFVDSIAGGGGLISLPAYMIAGLPVHTAIVYFKFMILIVLIKFRVIYQFWIRLHIVILYLQIVVPLIEMLTGTLQTLTVTFFFREHIFLRTPPHPDLR